MVDWEETHGFLLLQRLEERAEAVETQTVVELDQVEETAEEPVQI